MFFGAVRSVCEFVQIQLFNYVASPVESAYQRYGVPINVILLLIFSLNQ